MYVFAQTELQLSSYIHASKVIISSIHTSTNSYPAVILFEQMHAVADCQIIVSYLLATCLYFLL